MVDTQRECAQHAPAAPSAVIIPPAAFRMLTWWALHPPVQATSHPNRTAHVHNARATSNRASTILVVKEPTPELVLLALAQLETMIFPVVGSLRQSAIHASFLMVISLTFVRAALADTTSLAALEQATAPVFPQHAMPRPLHRMAMLARALPVWLMVDYAHPRVTLVLCWLESRHARKEC